VSGKKCRLAPPAPISPPAPCTKARQNSHIGGQIRGRENRETKRGWNGGRAELRV
jgi:hypothetical protein